VTLVTAGGGLDRPSDVCEPASVRGGSSDELRPVTVLFADVVGSTGLGERLGPDEVKALIGGCVSRMSRTVEEFGGTIQAYMGDGICAYFGVPSAHEDDPERAARAGLQIIDVVAEYAHDIEVAWGITDFDVRVGVNSGPAAVGTVGGAVPQTVALGDTTNVAARLQSAAEPGTVIVGELTATRLQQRFELEPVGEIKVKGRTRKVPAWRLVAARQAPVPGASAPTIGREVELERLAAVLAELRQGRGQVLLVSGEAGMGKTRLLAELRTMAGDEVTWLEGRCASYQREFLSRPFIEMARAFLGVTEDDPEILVRTKLRSKLVAAFGDDMDSVLPAFAGLLSVRSGVESGEGPRLTGEEAAARTREAYVELVERLAAARPIVLAVEDLHWAYAPSRELAEELLPATDRGAVLLVTTFRPDPSSEAWPFRVRAQAEFPHRTTEIHLGPLSEEAMREIADALVPRMFLPDPTRAEILARAEGNPLFLEELLRMVLPAEDAGRKRTWTFGADPTQLLPAALEGLFVSRIDRLPPEARATAQVAAVIGRTFPLDVLERVDAGEDLPGQLAVLLRADVIREQSRYPRLEYGFKNGLLQEAALSTLTPPRLRELYGRVAAAAEELFADSIGEHLEPLAFYYYRSDDPAKALGYVERAASKASALGLVPQAREMWGRVRKLAGRLSDDEAARRAEEALGELGAVP